MPYNSAIQPLIQRLVAGCLLAGLLALAGCGMKPADAERKTGEKVQRIIDANWQPELGGQPDLSMNSPDPNSPDPNALALLDTLRQSGTISLEQAVQLGLLTGHEYLTARDRLFRAGLLEADARHLYEINPFLGGLSGYSKNDGDETVVTQGTAGFSKLLATGALVTSNLTVGYMDVLTGDFRSGATSLLQATVTQPLLRGASRVAVMETLTQAQHDTLYAIRDFIRFRKSFCVDLAADYCRLIEFDWQVRNAQANLDQLNAVYATMEELNRAGRLANHELQQTRQDVLKAENLLVTTRTTLQENMDMFKLRIGIPAEYPLSVQLQAPLVASWPSSGWMQDEPNAIERALDLRLDLANAQDRIEDARRKIEVAADGLKAGLNLVAGADADRRRRIGADDTRSVYEASIQADFGLDRTYEAHDYQRARLDLAQSQRDLQQRREEIVAQIRKAWRDRLDAKTRYETQDQARELARKRLDNTTLLLPYGRANARDVLDARQDLLQAENDYANALADFSIAELRLLQHTELLWIDPVGQPQLRPGTLSAQNQ